MSERLLRQNIEASKVVRCTCRTQKLQNTMREALESIFKISPRGNVKDRKDMFIEMTQFRRRDKHEQFRLLYAFEKRLNEDEVEKLKELQQALKLTSIKQARNAVRHFWYPISTEREYIDTLLEVLADCPKPCELRCAMKEYCSQRSIS